MGKRAVCQRKAIQRAKLQHCFDKNAIDLRSTVFQSLLERINSRQCNFGSYVLAKSCLFISRDTTTVVMICLKDQKRLLPNEVPDIFLCKHSWKFDRTRKSCGNTGLQQTSFPPKTKNNLSGIDISQANGLNVSLCPFIFSRYNAMNWFKENTNFTIFFRGLTGCGNEVEGLMHCCDLLTVLWVHEGKMKNHRVKRSGKNKQNILLKRALGERKHSIFFAVSFLFFYYKD